MQDRTSLDNGPLTLVITITAATTVAAARLSI